MDVLKRKRLSERLEEVLKNLGSPLVVVGKKKKKMKPYCILKINEHGALVMEGYYKSRIVNVLIPANGGSVRDQVLELQESTWGHAHEIVQEFVLPKIDEIVTHLKVFGKYELF